jgi:hypothetical protein
VHGIRGVEMSKVLNGVLRIAKERDRQIAKEGWTAEHDDEHEDGELALVAALYATPIKLYHGEFHGPNEMRFKDPWPNTWAHIWDKRPYYATSGFIRENKSLPIGRRIRQLEKAGALIAAEIDRLQRVASKRD